MVVIRECDIFNDDSAEIIEVKEEKPKDDKILKAYLEGKEDAIKELLAKADCDNKECWDCPFGRAEGCLLNHNSKENK